MEKSNKRGKIPQSDWPLIMARYDAGETLASIARTYGCSPPAISYVVSRSRARHTGVAADTPPKPPSTAEPQLIKAVGSVSGAAAGQIPANDATATQANGHAAAGPNGSGEAERRPAPQPHALQPNPARETNGFGRAEPAQPDAAAQLVAAQRPAAPEIRPPPQASGGDQRPRLHLSLGSGGTGNGHSQPAEPAVANRAQPVAPQAAAPALAPTPGFAEIRPAFDEPPRRSEGEGQRKEGGGSFIDKELRARVDSDIATFLAAFDASLEEDTQESRSALREATDRLLRAGARTRIELERLEARIPLPPRNRGDSEPAWRQR
jgi:hypothetical protein